MTRRPLLAVDDARTRTTVSIRARALPGDVGLRTASGAKRPGQASGMRKTQDEPLGLATSPS